MLVAGDTAAWWYHLMPPKVVEARVVRRVGRVQGIMKGAEAVYEPEVVSIKARVHEGLVRVLNYRVVRVCE